MDESHAWRIRKAAGISLHGCREIVVYTIAAATLSIGLLFLNVEVCLGAQHQQLDSLQDFHQRLQNLASLSPDPCRPHSGNEKAWDSGNTEFRLFSRAAQFVAAALNTAGPEDRALEARVATALKKLEAESAEINADWPDESRFHFQILDASPALVVKMTIRTDARYFVFAIPDEGVLGNGKQPWQQVGSDDIYLQDPARALIDLYPLHRGPSGDARFLAKISYFGCAGSIGVVYDAREWSPDGLGELRKIIKQDGAFGLDDKVPGFPQIGRLRTEGSRITLPYCKFSPIDTWDNPSLCALDTYDISGDTVRFLSRIYNRPDLLPIAKALEFAERRDYPAVLGYCASSQLAHRLVRMIRPHVFADDIRVTRTGDGKERVELDDGAYQFDVEKRGSRWIVAAFLMQ